MILPLVHRRLVVTLEPLGRPADLDPMPGADDAELVRYARGTVARRGAGNAVGFGLMYTYVP